MTPTRAQLAEFNRGVEKARVSYDRDPFAASRLYAVARARRLWMTRRIGRTEHRAMIDEVAEW